MNEFISEIRENEFPDILKNFKNHTRLLKEKVVNEEPELIFTAIRLLTDPQLGFGKLKILMNICNRIDSIRKTNKHSLKVAVLGSGTLNQITWLIKLFLLYYGIDAETYEGVYGSYEEEIYNIESGLHQFNPDVVILLTDHRDIKTNISLADSESKVESMVDLEAQRWITLWNTIESKIQCPCIQNNFDFIVDNSLGSLSFNMASSKNHFIDLLNLKIMKAKPSWLYFHDLRNLVGEIGRKSWYDRRFYFHSKQHCSLEALPAYAFSVSSIINAIFGKPKKCMVVDLDNTLWGGIIGDDGIEGIEIGQGSAVGEAYQDFQKYIISLKERGIILAVCSKNTDNIAKEPFINHPDMLLKMDDIACFVANWEEKTTNLKMISKKLNIGIDSIVFIDDNPLERAIVRNYFPDVAVPFLPDDPSGFISAIEPYRFFEQAGLTSEDLIKTEQYKSNEKREKFYLQSGYNFNEFMECLNIEVCVKKLDKVEIVRVQQLLNKTNQFNLTGRRYSTSELEEIMQSSNRVGVSVRARDRFGDYGLISVLIASIHGEKMELDTWVMSCRVFGRGIDKFIFNYLYNLAREMEMKKIIGTYIKTRKNDYVKSLYPALGMGLIKGTETEMMTFEGSIYDNWQPHETFIKEYK